MFQTLGFHSLEHPTIEQCERKGSRGYVGVRAESIGYTSNEMYMKPTWRQDGFVAVEARQRFLPDLVIPVVVVSFRWLGGRPIVYLFIMKAMSAINQAITLPLGM